MPPSLSLVSARSELRFRNCSIRSDSREVEPYILPLVGSGVWPVKCNYGKAYPDDDVDDAAETQAPLEPSTMDDGMTMLSLN